MKKMVNPFDYSGVICSAMKKGILLTGSADGKPNTMAIGWGMMGIEWGKPVFIAYVRDSRYTRELLEKNGEFTVNIPIGADSQKIIKYCGSHSGRDEDKFKTLGLTAVEPEVISVPGIRELPLTLECKVIHKQRQDLTDLPQDLLDRYYPGEASGWDVHTAYYGEIVSSYIISD